MSALPNTPGKRALLAWCARCNAEKPSVKAYPAEGARYRVRVCMICHERVDTGRRWSAAIPTKDATGKLRPSKAEAERGNWLLAAQQGGTISELRFCNDHPKETYRLEVYGTLVVERLLEALESGSLPGSLPGSLGTLAVDVRRSRIFLCCYTPDHTYLDDRGLRHTEDTKGRKSRDYVIKKRLMLACHEIEVEEP